MDGDNKLVQIIKKSYRTRHRIVGLSEELRRRITQSLRTPASTVTSDIANIIITEIRRKQRTKTQTSLDLKHINPQYHVILNDDSVYNPFIADARLILLVNNKIKGLKTDYEKARGIYEWMEQNISYGNPESVKQRGYLSSKETLKTKSGICAEMTFLYVTMARSAGLVAKVAYVSKDFRGEKVEHACAAVLLEGRVSLVDVAYHAFDIKHKEFKIMSDREVIRMYNSLKGAY